MGMADKAIAASAAAAAAAFGSALAFAAAALASAGDKTGGAGGASKTYQEKVINMLCQNTISSKNTVICTIGRI